MDNFEELLPPWAIGLARGTLMVGAQLATRDGRRMGNAHIIGGTKVNEVMYYTILTDAGNECKFTAGEIAHQFYPPKYIADVSEIIRKFKR